MPGPAQDTLFTLPAPPTRRRTPRKKPTPTPQPPTVDPLIAAAKTRLAPPCDCDSPGLLHCEDCHRDFANQFAYHFHRPSVLHRCSPPEHAADCDTGQPLLYRQGQTWHVNYHPNQP